MYEYFVWIRVCAAPVCLVPAEVRREHQIPRSGVKDSPELPCEYRELNLGPLQEEQVLLTSALMRQPPLFTGDTQFSGRGPLSILKFFTLSTFLPRLATGSSEDAAAA